MNEDLNELQRLFEQGKYDEALYKAQSLTKQHFKSSHFCSFIGACEYKIGSYEQAEKTLKYALSLDRNNFDANNTLGSVLLEKGKFVKAKNYYKIALKINNSSAEATYNLGKAYRSLGDLKRAKRYFLKAIELNPKMSFAYNNLATCLKAEGDIENAIFAARRAVALDNDFRISKWNLAQLLLMNEEYNEGYKYYIYGFNLNLKETKLQRGKYIGDPALEWSGENDSANLIVWGEQGIGDELMFSNFIKYIPPNIQKIEVRVQEKMVRLLQEKLSYDKRIIVTRRNDEMGNSPHIPIGNLPALYWDQFFVEQNEKSVQYRFPKLSDKTDAIVGINWRGGRNEESRAKRSVSLSLFKNIPFFRYSNCRILPLQYDATKEELHQLRETFAGNVLSLDYDPKENVDAWSRDIKRCDFLLSVDNSAVHIAGEYEIPTILLLSSNCDSRWGRTSEKTIWYPSLKLVRNVDQMTQNETISKIKGLMEGDLNNGYTTSSNSNLESREQNMLLRLEDFSEKGQLLVEQYTIMADAGYETIFNEKVTNAYNDFEIRRYKEHVKPLFRELGIKSLLDYGCGGSDYESGKFAEGVSARQFFELERVSLYEPSRGIDQREKSDAVVCFDVLEHIFITDIPRVLKEIFSLAKKLVILNIAAYRARALLPNGENAHITVRDLHWWKGMVDSIAIQFPNVMVKLWVCPKYTEAHGFKLYSAADWLDQDSFVTD